jgi:xanthine dehydrogenase accessory factor
MLFPNHLILLRGGGDLATGVAYRLHKAGFPIVVLERPDPLVVRRQVALATAVLEGAITVEDLRAVRVDSFAEGLGLASTGAIPVLVAPDLATIYPASEDANSGIGIQGSGGAGEQGSQEAATRHLPLVARRSSLILVDARMAKRNLDTTIDQAPLVIALGPGYTAGVDCHAVIETNRGHRLGRVIWDGAAEANTGTPGIVAGKGAERVLRAPAAGVVQWRKAIGDRVRAGEVLGTVAGQAVVAPFDGVARGLIAPGTAVPAKLKIGDVDPRGDVATCFTISEKALAVGGGVVEAVLTWLGRQEVQE